MAKREKSKTAGSIYFNVDKDASDKLQDKLRKAVEWMLENKIWLSISIKDDDDDYVRYNGTFNQYKAESDDPAKAPDVVLFKRDMRDPIKPTKRPEKKEESDDDDAPF